RPVKKLVAAPIRKRTAPLSARLVSTADDPVLKKKGATGKIAPAANRKNDAAAAVHGEPPRSLGSMPSSSRASVSSAVALFAIRRPASAFASCSDNPFA